MCHGCSNALALVTVIVSQLQHDPSSYLFLLPQRSTQLFLVPYMLLSAAAVHQKFASLRPPPAPIFSHDAALPAKLPHVPRSAVLISPGLVLGNRSAASNAAELKRCSICALVSVGGGKAANSDLPPGAVHHMTNIRDTEDTHFDLASLHAACDFAALRMLEGGVVMVYCMGGLSRSPSVCMAMLVKFGGRTLFDAYTEVCRARPAVKPHANFQADLLQFEQQVLKCTSVRPLLSGDRSEVWKSA